MKFLKYCLLPTAYCLLILAGCKSVPITTNTQTNTKNDSTVSTSSKKDSTYYKETLTEKTLPAASVSLKLTRAQLDSLLTALQNMPQGTRTIYLQDKNTRAQLAVLFDSLGSIQFKCTSMEKIYFEKNIEQSRYIESLVNELSKSKTESNTLRKELVEAKKPFWQRVKDWGNNLLLTLCLCVIAGGLTAILITKGWNFFKSLLFKPRV